MREEMNYSYLPYAKVHSSVYDLDACSQLPYRLFHLISESHASRSPPSFGRRFLPSAAPTWLCHGTSTVKHRPCGPEGWVEYIAVVSPSFWNKYSLAASDMNSLSSLPLLKTLEDHSIRSGLGWVGGGGGSKLLFLSGTK